MAKGQAYAGHFFFFMNTLKDVKWLPVASCMFPSMHITTLLHKVKEKWVCTFLFHGCCFHRGTEPRYCWLLDKKWFIYLFLFSQEYLQNENEDLIMVSASLDSTAAFPQISGCSTAVWQMMQSSSSSSHVHRVPHRQGCSFVANTWVLLSTRFLLYGSSPWPTFPQSTFLVRMPRDDSYAFYF